MTKDEKIKSYLRSMYWSFHSKTQSARLHHESVAKATLESMNKIDYSEAKELWNFYKRK